MISNTSEFPVLAGGSIKLQSIKNPTDLSTRRTKIICTIGPKYWDIPDIEKLIEAGMTAARLNFSHGDHGKHYACFRRIREASKNKMQNVGIILDTAGPEVRIGTFANNDAKEAIFLKQKEEIILATSDYSFEGSSKKVAVSYPNLPSLVNIGQRIIVGTGLVLTVLSTNVEAGEVTCRIENDYELTETSKVNIPSVNVCLPTFSKRDVEDIKFGVKIGVDFVAASFIRSAADVNELRSILGEGGQGVKIISKIECMEGLKNYPEILRSSDAIMVARGDLGRELPPEKVFLAQKYMIREANIAGKPIIVATQFLESMVKNPRPTRAECGDVANAIYDGTDCVMLGAETAVGNFPLESVCMMARTCCEAESTVNHHLLYQTIRNSTIARYGRMSPGESIASSAVKTAYDVNAKIIVVFSESGTTARQIAKFRPGMPVCVLTPSKKVARQCFALFKGAYSFVVEDLEDTDKLVQDTTNEVRMAGVCNEGDPYVLVCGNTFGMGATNQVKVQLVESSYWDYPVGEGRSSAHSLGREEKHGCVIS